MDLVKLTTTDDTTRNGMRWGPGVEHTAPGGDLCTADVLHAYATPEHAAMFAPLHGMAGERHWWRADGDVCADDGTKIGCARLHTIERMEPLTLTTEQRAEVAIRCAMTVCHDPAWRAWADAWLSGADRSRTAARAAATAARAAAWAEAARAAAWAAATAAAEIDLPAIVRDVLARG